MLKNRPNLLIKGNNLIALHTLKEYFRHAPQQDKVKLIYIDPPYNTGNDSFNYNDRFNHSTWLTFMKNRLEIARELLRADGISASVINMHTVKPLDTSLLIAEAQQTGAIVTTEEHNVLGGLGSAVAEALCEVCPVPVVKHGVPDQFGKSGAGKDLLEYFGLNAKGIAAKAKEALKLKRVR